MTFEGVVKNLTSYLKGPSATEEVYFLLIFEGVVFAVTYVAVAMDVFHFVRSHFNPAIDVMVRGSTSMSSLYAFYALAVYLAWFLIDRVPGIEGHKLILMVPNVACLTYLVFSSWFRNKIFFEMMVRIARD